MMQIGDELVNINGTPLYGSRQEALILIKGSYRTLKMIVRRRNVPVIRPHSWHLAKLSEVRPEAGNMHFPPDTFSLSWHSGCETSDLSMQWNQLSRHCSTDKSSSIGSMESLDQPSQTYYEGNLSPIDQNMYHNKRDSAYSSFSASSNASDYTVSLKAEESASMDCIIQGLGPCKHNDGRYLQTGNGIGETTEDDASMHRPCGHSEPNSRPPSCTYEQTSSVSCKAPPQPPVRRDSLRAPKNHPNQEKRRASAPVDSLHVTGRWTSDGSLSCRDKVGDGRSCGQMFSLCSEHMKDCLPSDQYYMLSSHPDKCRKCTEPLLGKYADQYTECSIEKNAMTNHVACDNRKDSQGSSSSQDAATTGIDCTTSCAKEHLTGQLAHWHSASEKSQPSCVEQPSDSTNCSYGSGPKLMQERHQWTLSPLHSSQRHRDCPTLNENTKEQPCEDTAARDGWKETSREDVCKSKGKTQECGSRHPTGSRSPPTSRSCSSLERSLPNGQADPPQDLQPSSELHSANAVGLRPAHSTETLVEEPNNQEEARLHVKKPGSSRFRSAQIRRRSERFATNLRNEIQRRKAQLHKSNGSMNLLCGEEPVEEMEEPSECPSPPRLPLPPPPPPKPRSPRPELEKVKDLRKPDSSEHLLEMPKKHDMKVSGIQRVTNNVVDDQSVLDDTRTTSNPKNSPPTLESKPCSDVWHAMSSECPSQEPKSQDPILYQTLRPTGQEPDRPCAVTAMKWNTMCPSPDMEQQRALHASYGEGGRWTWSPEEKLPPKARQAKESQPERMANEWPPRTYELEPGNPTAPNRNTQETVLLPFADRRKFFEETFRGVPVSHLPNLVLKTRTPNIRPKHAEPSVFQPVIPDCRNVRRHSVDHSYSPASPVGHNAAAAPYTDCVINDIVEQPVCYTQGKHSGEQDYVRALSHACSAHGAVLHDSCMYCSGELCPAFIKMNLQPSHHSFCCHHHQWARCGECFCPSQHKVLEESVFRHNDPWPSRKPCFQELPLDEREKAAPISRQASKSVSELSHCKVGFQRTSPLRPRCDRDHEWSMCYRSVSSQDLSCDCDRPNRAVDISPYEDSLVDPPPLSLRGRAFSESHINFEPLTSRVRERREPVLSKLEENPPGSQRAAKKKAPPRPPPPKWGRLGTRRASHQHLYNSSDTPSTGPAHQTVPPEALLQQQQQQRRSEMEAARQRSQSLPLEKVHGGFLKPVAIQPPQVNCHDPREYSHSTNTEHPSKWDLDNMYYNMPERTADPLVANSGHHDTPSSSPYRLDARHFEENGDLERSTGSDAGDRSSLSSWTDEWHKSQPVSPTPAQGHMQGGAEDEETCHAEILRRPPVRMTSEELMRDVAGRDRSLAMVLSQASGMVTTAEVMGELFCKGDRQSWTEHFEKDWSAEQPYENSGQERYEFQPISPPPPPGGSVSPTSYSAYYNTSAGKAELLNKMKELPEVSEEDSEGEEMDAELAEKKLQLIESISKKLSVLQEAQRGLLEDIGANTSLGEEVETLVRTVCKPNELDKYRMFIGDLDKVVNLLLSLSGRLARVENALNSLDPETSPEEKLVLIEKKRQLAEQLEEAKELKEHVDRREKVVHDTVSRYLTADQLLDYHHFVKMKSALIIEQRELEEKIKLGEEQLRCLRESLPNPRDY
ncbi:protein Shroom4 isoform X2 [Ambystoma mexicanum]